MFVFITILVGILLLIAEVTVIPGFGIAGVSGIIFMSIGMVYAYMTLSGLYAALAIGSGIIAGTAITGWALFIFPKTRAAKKLALNPTIEQENAIAVDSHSELIGLEGITTSILRPSGKAKICDEIYDVVSDGGIYIEKDVKVIVKNATFGKITVVAKQ